MFAGKNQRGNGGRIDPSRLTEQQFDIVERLKSNIICTVDPLTNVISLKVNAQDPLVAANLTDSVCERLKTFITSYRTSKARVDVDYYEKLAQEAQINYKKAQDEYSAFCDTHKNITQQATLSKRDDLEREVSMALSIYQTMITQVEKHKTKLQEDTPVFTTLQNASVPIKPSAPKRVLFCLGMLMLATIITSARILKDELYSTIVFFSAKSKGTDNKED
jgi:capsule polysaccharide export protein KpsE/RkpR